MVNKIFASVVIADILFLLTGALALGFSLVTQNHMNNMPDDGKDAARKLIAQKLPLTAGVADGVVILLAFVITLPGMWLPGRGWLKLSSAVVAATSIFTLSLGIYTWVITLRLKGDFNQIYLEQSPEVHKIFQDTFKCCGYKNSMTPAFVTNAMCPSPAAAALVTGCAGPITSYANQFLDYVFTAMFAFVGVDALFVVSIACLLKDRKERERYRYIDEKTGYYQI